ncbi:hypothetical protein K1X12_04555 [Hyphomonas sp. WL0036]|uniref:hypothetical protein n=1 Tax=Hyphomonas sediminis TaxID=2866160 RepID=UPI001C809640|nr:hypothetical protein [Hyphomonas sediminis]MBY9066157.1 hypothetical protein [Hyphomonas sediminis]
MGGQRKPPRKGLSLVVDPRSWPIDRLVALIVSIGALAAMTASVRSCKVGEQQAQIAERSFVRGQQVMLPVTYEPGLIRLKAVEANHLLQAGHVSLPSEVSLAEQAIGPGGAIAYDYGFAADIRRYLMEKLKLRAEVISSGEISLPVMIFSYCTVSGEPREDISAYWMTLRFRVSLERGVFELEPTSMVFATRFAENMAQGGREALDYYQQELDAIFESSGLELKVSHLGAPKVVAPPPQGGALKPYRKGRWRGPSGGIRMMPCMLFLLP